MNTDKIKKKAAADGIKLIYASAPRSTLSSVKKFRTKCAENVCGSYGVSWTCPPAVGTPAECINRLKGFDKAVIMTKMFTDIADVRDIETMERLSKENQGACRSVKHMLEEEGYEALALSGGPCRFCTKCSYPDPCRFPGEQVSSVSGYGIDMGKYLKSNGIDFEFSDNEVTLYAIVLFR